MTAIFWGVAYESRIKALVAAFEEAGPGELIHPVFGSLTVAVRRWQIQHSAERHDYATVTFEAVEAVTDNPFFGATSSRSLAEQALADISSSLDEALGLSESELGKTLGQWADTAANIKARVETELQGVLDVLDAGRSVVRSVLSYVDVPAAFVADAQAIVRGLQADAASASSSVVSAFGVLSTALPLLSLTAPEAVKAYATGAGAYGPAWVSGPQSALSGKAEAQLALRVPRPAVATIPVPDAGSARTPQGVAVTHVTLLEAQTTAQAASEALKADMASPALTPGEIEGLAGNVRARLDDALHYTAAALHQMLHHPAKPVIITGSQLPLTMEGSDGPRNLRDAFFTACEGVPGVYVVFHGDVIDGARAKKMHTERFAAYASVNAPLARITPSGVQWKERRSPDGEAFRLVTGLERRVCVLKLIPGFRGISGHKQAAPDWGR